MADILDPSNRDRREAIVRLLTQGYWMEMETVMSYTANSINPDGMRADPIRASLLTDVQEELAHAQLFGRRIKELYGQVPGTREFTAVQHELQPPADALDLAHVIRGVIAAEQGAIAHYNAIIDACDGIDPVTQDMVTTILADEQGHLRQFEGFLREYEAG
ncbi:unannotated protein [freshwater metagenome]|uniref:Unannotated protein n=1 Tax=freshwater metagenome TaxID=449393 RepID=A0A6J7HEQ9_9ZZZZ|nr:rubrerythrin [Actinomycetota bacterium]